MSLDPNSIEDLKSRDFSIRPRRQFSVGTEVAAVGSIHLESGDMSMKRKLNEDPRDVHRSGGQMTDQELLDQVFWENGEAIFAIRGSKYAPKTMRGEMIGEIQLYEIEQELKDRLIKTKLLPESLEDKIVLETSTMVDFDSRFGPGIGSSARRVTCLKVLEAYQAFYNTDEEPEIITFVEDSNVEALRSVEATGFVKIGRINYEPDSTDEDNVFKLDWDKLRKNLKKNSHYTPTLNSTTSPSAIT